MRPFPRSSAGAADRARTSVHRSACMLVIVLLATVTACGPDPAPGGDGQPDAGAEPGLEGMLERLEVDYGCGHGFYASDAEQTLGLFIFATDPQLTEDELGIPGEIEFPDDRWDAHVEVGEDLFANWCDDVVMPDDPEPVTDESFEVTGGTMTVTRDGPDTFTATLSGVEVDRPDGTVVDLGGVTTTNDLWGVYAG